MFVVSLRGKFSLESGVPLGPLFPGRGPLPSPPAIRGRVVPQVFRLGVPCAQTNFGGYGVWTYSEETAKQRPEAIPMEN